MKQWLIDGHGLDTALSHRTFVVGDIQNEEDQTSTMTVFMKEEQNARAVEAEARAVNRRARGRAGRGPTIGRQRGGRGRPSAA